MLFDCLSAGKKRKKEEKRGRKEGRRKEEEKKEREQKKEKGKKKEKRKKERRDLPLQKSIGAINGKFLCECYKNIIVYFGHSRVLHGNS